MTAVDAAPAMCERLAAAYPAAAVYVMDAQALDFPPGTFNLVAASFVVHVLDDPAAGVREAYRVLAPAGRFAFTGCSARHYNTNRADEQAPPEAPSLGSRLNDLFEEFSVHLPPGGSMGQPVDAAELLEDAGFIDLREDHAAVAVPFPDNATLWRWAMTHGYRAFIEDLPVGRRREFYQRVMELPHDDRILRRKTGARDVSAGLSRRRFTETVPVAMSGGRWRAARGSSA